MAMDMATLGIKVDATDVTKASVELDKLSTAGGKTAKAMSSVEKSMQGLTGLFAGLGLGALAKSVLDTNREMESLRASLKSVMGSAQGAQGAFNAILTFAKDTPYEIKGLTQTFIMLQNMGIKPTHQVMQSLTDQASKLGGSQETLTSIALQLGQAHSKGKLQMEDMVVLMQRGVPVMKLLAEVTGKNSAELADMSAKGTITVDMIDKLIVKMGEAASGSNANAMETLNGKISSLSDAWHSFEDALLNDKSEGYLKTVVSNWTAWLDYFKDSIAGVGKEFLALEEINNKIVSSKAKIAAMSQGGVSGAAWQVAGALTGNSIEGEKNRLSDFIKQREGVIKTTHDVIVAKNQETAATDKLLNSTNQEKKALEETLQSKKEHEKAAKAAARAEASLTKSYDDTVKALSLNNVEQSQSKRQLEEATLASKGYNKAMIAQAMALWDAGAALAAKKQLNEEEKSQLDSLIDRYNKATMSARDYYSSTLTVTSPDGIKSPMSGADKAPLLSQFDKTSGAETAKKATDDATASLDAYNKKLDDANTKTSDLGAVTSAIFDGALAGINGMAGAFDSMVNSIASSTKALEENAAMQKANESEKDPEKQAANIKKYATEEINLNNKVLSAKLKAGSQIAGFLSSSLKKGSTEQKAAHAIQMALAGAELAMNLMKLLGIKAVTAEEVASVGPSTGASLAKGTAKACEAVATQAGAGPYIGFALMAAMAAAMAAIGFATFGGGGGGGGGGSSSGPPPSNANLGTGTVLGDPAAVSESIGHTNDLLKSIHADEYIELRGINKGIQTLQGNILSAVTKEFQLGSLTGTSAPNLGKSGHTMVGGGMQTGAIVMSDILAGMEVVGQMYTTDAVKKKGKTTFTYEDFFSPMDKSLNESLTKVFKNIGTVMLETGSLLGKNIGVDFSQKINEAVIPALKIDTMSMTGEEAVARANAVISSMLDDLSMSVFGDVLKNYQQLGEGMLETTIRIVAEIAIVKDALNQSGLTITTNVIAISDAIVQAAGGLEEFQKQFESFLDKFYSDTEKQTRSQKALMGLLAEANVILPTTRENYKKLVEGLNMTNPLDQQRYSLLLELSESADKYYSMLESGAEKVAAIAKTQRSLDIQYMELTGDAVGALTEKRKDELAAMDESLRFSQKLVWALTGANTAVSSAISAVSKSITVMTTLATKLRSALATTTTSTTITADSRKAAQEVLNGALRIAKKGGSIDAIAGMDKALTDIAKPSEQLYSTFTDYARDQAKTAATITDLAAYADSQVSMAQKQIDAVNGTTAAVMTIKDAMVALSKALGVKDSIVSTGNTAKDAMAKSNAASARSKAANDKAAGSALALSDAKAASKANKSTTQTQANKDTAAVTNATKGLADLNTARDYAAAVGAWGAYYSYQSYIDSASQKIAELTITAAKSAKAAALAAADVLTGASYAKLSSTAAKDANAASAAQAVYKTAKTYSDAAQNAVPTINGFASGGQHEGGWRIVGENGPELEKTGASRIFSNGQSKSLLNMDELLAEIRQLREDARANANAVEKNTAETSRIINRWDGDGMPAVRITA
jgi:tape measure domain-containing protein